MRAMLIAVMFCGFPLGSTLGGVVSAPLLGAFGWQSVFVLGGVLPLLTPVALVFPGRDIVRGDAPALRPCDGRHGDHGSTAQRPLTPWA
jgi:MFS family permease